jgi:integrase
MRSARVSSVARVAVSAAPRLSSRARDCTWPVNSSCCKNQILPVLGSRRLDTFTSSVVEDFIMSMKEQGVGLTTQQNAFDTLKKILIDAKRKSALSEDPFEGVVPPEYVPEQVVIPTLEEIHALKAAADDDLRLIIDLMSGCGLRNGEAFAANVERMVANDAYRITEQIDGITHERSRLKPRKPGEFREVPMPATGRDSLLTYQKEHGASAEGYLLSTQRSAQRGHSTLAYRWGRLKDRASIDRKLKPYSLRHYFASNCLSKGIPITDVAEWMGHSDIRITFRIYRHLMPAGGETEVRRGHLRAEHLVDEDTGCGVGGGGDEGESCRGNSRGSPVPEDSADSHAGFLVGYLGSKVQTVPVSVAPVFHLTAPKEVAWRYSVPVFWLLRRNPPEETGSRVHCASAPVPPEFQMTELFAAAARLNRPARALRIVQVPDEVWVRTQSWSS